MQRHRASTTLAPPLPSPATGLPRQGGGEAAHLWCWRKRMGSRVRGQRSHTSSNMPGAPITHQSRPRACVFLPTHTQTHTDTLSHTGRLPFQALCLPTPDPIHPTGQSSDPRTAHRMRASQMAQGSDLYALSLALPTGVRGTEAWSTTPSSTLLPPLPQSNQMTRCPQFTANDKSTGAGTTCPKMHSSTTTHRFP